MTASPSATRSPRAWLGPRGRLILQTGSWSLVAKAAAAANLFVSVPFVLHALGPARFGAWATLVSVVVFAGFLDFGFGNGTMNLVAAAHGRGQSAEVAMVVREARRALARIGLAIAVLACLVAPWVPWHHLLGLPSTLAGESRWAAMAVLLAMALAVPLNLATRVQLGLGQGERAFRWQAFGQLLALAMVISLSRVSASLPVLTAAAALAPLAGAVANTLALGRDPAMVPPPTRRPDLAARIRHEGLLFFVLQLSAALAFSADLPLIAALRGPSEAGTYAIVQRLFSIVPLALGLVWAPLWPIYRRALASSDHAWVAAALKRSIWLSVATATIGSLLLIVLFDPIANIWLRGSLPVGLFYLFGFAIWSVVDALGASLGTFLNASSLLRFQVTIATIFCITCLALKAMAIWKLGAFAGPWVTALTYIFTSLLPIRIYWKTLYKSALSKSY